MIVDRLNNWKIYFTSPLWKTIFTELKALDENTAEMEKSILGDDIILKIFSYTTVVAGDELAELESHKKYIDIHTTIKGSERIDWHPASDLKIVKPYDPVEDAIYYFKPEFAHTNIIMNPGMFAIFGPADAHMPRLHAAGKSQRVKKAVMKISAGAVS